MRNCCQEQEVEATRAVAEQMRAGLTGARRVPAQQAAELEAKRRADEGVAGNREEAVVAYATALQQEPEAREAE